MFLLCSRRVCEAARAIFLIREGFASLPRQLFFLASRPQVRRSKFSHSRAARKSAEADFLPRGPLAILPERFFSFAKGSRDCRSDFSPSRAAREHHRLRTPLLFMFGLAHTISIIYLIALAVPPGNIAFRFGFAGLQQMRVVLQLYYSE